MLLQQSESAALKKRFHPASLSSHHAPLTELRANTENLLCDMAFALTLTHRVKQSILTERGSRA